MVSFVLGFLAWWLLCTHLESTTAAGLTLLPMRPSSTPLLTGELDFFFFTRKLFGNSSCGESPASGEDEWLAQRGVFTSL
jgi:hypothetical protein